MDYYHLPIPGGWKAELASWLTLQSLHTKFTHKTIHQAHGRESPLAKDRRCYATTLCCCWMYYMYN